MWDAIHDVFLVIRDYLSTAGFDCRDPVENVELMAVKQETYNQVYQTKPGAASFNDDPVFADLEAITYPTDDAMLEEQPTRAAGTGDRAGPDIPGALEGPALTGEQPTEDAAAEDTIIVGTTKILADDPTQSDDDASSKAPTEEPPSPPRPVSPEGPVENVDPYSPKTSPKKSPSPSPEQMDYALKIIPEISTMAGDRDTLPDTEIAKMDVDAPTDIPTNEDVEMVEETSAPDVDASTELADDSVKGTIEEVPKLSTEDVVPTPTETPITEPDTGVEQPQAEAMVIDDIANTEESAEISQQSTDIPATDSSKAPTDVSKLATDIPVPEVVEAPKTIDFFSLNNIYYM
ncbi:pollen-specific leucine-rich repeat extensin-like protein 2 [Salvia miltiorrhiza]|uniref:pollen-specific leucine-rich repeat extensin-like protein 2 n=1 Tax=Salvia miltiorrhiza TaxID=226208 RepID=UPI0025AC4D11|nr:pollen-specific leucine-rich repeat extensin-like protein 2 [Salvia miltiorrhiza]